MSVQLRGIIPPLVTPFLDGSEDLDEDGLRAVGPEVRARLVSSPPIVGAALRALDEIGAPPEAHDRLRRELEAEAAKLGGNDG